MTNPSPPQTPPLPFRAFSCHKCGGDLYHVWFNGVIECKKHFEENFIDHDLEPAGIHNPNIGYGTNEIP